MSCADISSASISGLGGVAPSICMTGGTKALPKPGGGVMERCSGCCMSVPIEVASFETPCRRNDQSQIWSREGKVPTEADLRVLVVPAPVKVSVFGACGFDASGGLSKPLCRASSISDGLFSVKGGCVGEGSETFTSGAGTGKFWSMKQETG